MSAVTKRDADRVADWLETLGREVAIEPLAEKMMDYRAAVAAEYIAAASTLRAAAWFARPTVWRRVLDEVTYLLSFLRKTHHE